MTKAETLQKYLPCHTTYGDFELCVECPYNPKPGKIWEYGCVHGQDKMIDDAISMLKEEEPIAPGLEQDVDSIYSTCGKCKTKLYKLFGVEFEINPDAMPKFCPKCGKKVKWK